MLVQVYWDILVADLNIVSHWHILNPMTETLYFNVTNFKYYQSFTICVAWTTEDNELIFEIKAFCCVNNYVPLVTTCLGLWLFLVFLMFASFLFHLLSFYCWLYKLYSLCHHHYRKKNQLTYIKMHIRVKPI